MPPFFVGEDPTFEVRDGMLHVAGPEHCYAVPLARARKLNRGVAAAIAIEDARIRAALVKLPKRKKKRAH